MGPFLGGLAVPIAAMILDYLLVGTKPGVVNTVLFVPLWFGWWALFANWRRAYD